MSNFTSNTYMYNIVTENEIANILSHFNSEFIFDIIKDNIQKRYMYNYTTSPNIVASFEQNFNQIKNTYQTDLQQIDQVRLDTYLEVIKIICNEYQLQFNDDDSIDLYSAAYYLYDFLVANFNNYLTLFFALYIYKERSNIYDSMGLSAYKKSKDSSTLYGKKIYKDIKIAVINAYLDNVIDNMAYFDITIQDILYTIYPDRNIANFINNLISPINDFFKTYYMSVFMTDIRPIILSNIRIQIQKLAIPEDQQISDIIGGE